MVLAQNTLETLGDSCEIILRFDSHLTKLLVMNSKNKE